MFSHVLLMTVAVEAFSWRSLVYVDLVGALPRSTGYKYLLICDDRFTRLPEEVKARLVDFDIPAHRFDVHLRCIGPLILL